MGCDIDSRNLSRERAFLSRGRGHRTQQRKVEMVVGESSGRATASQISRGGVEDGILLGKARRPARRSLVEVNGTRRLLGSLRERARGDGRGRLQWSRRPSVWITKATEAKKRESAICGVRGLGEWHGDYQTPAATARQTQMSLSWPPPESSPGGKDPAHILDIPGSCLLLASTHSNSDDCLILLL